MKLNKIELTTNNTIQIQEIIEHGEGELSTRTLLRRTTDSRQDNTLEHDFIQQAAAAFPYIEEEAGHEEGIHEDIGFMRLTMQDLTQFRYDIAVHVVEGGVTVSSERKAPLVVSMLDDVSSLPAKVQKVAALMFTASARTAYVAALPRVEVPIKAAVQDTIFVDSGKTEKATRPCKHPEHTKMIDGKMVFIPECDGVEEYNKPVGTDELVWNADGSPKMSEIDTGKTETKIEYKGTLYNEASLVTA
jgi:hypothetical protein